MKRMRQLLAAGIGVSALGLAGLAAESEYEKAHFETVKYNICSGKIPPSFDGYSTVFLADLHNHTFGKDNCRLLKAIDGLCPDSVMVGGDMVLARGPRSLKVPLGLMEALRKKYPVYYGLGNHERRMNVERDVYGDLYDRYIGRLEGLGVHMMKDCSCVLEKDGGRIRITGIDLPKWYYKKIGKRPLSQEALKEIVGEGHCGEYHILLAHSPLYFHEYVRWGADLVLAGHFHGGTIRLPFLGGVMTPNYMFFPEYDRGLYEFQGRHMVLSGGLGTHSVNIRLNNRPQLILIRLCRSFDNH